MSGWEAASAIGACISAGGILILANQVTEARKARGVSEATAYNEARGRMDAQAPQVEVHLSPPVWPPLNASGGPGVPQAWLSNHEWHLPRDRGQTVHLQASVTVTNRSAATVHLTFDGDLWEDDSDPGAMGPQRMPPMLLGPAQEVQLLLRGGLSLEQWAERRGPESEGLEPVVTGQITAHGDADEGVIDAWHPWLTATPIEEDFRRGSVWHLTQTTRFAEERGQGCQQYDLQPPRHRTYWLSRAGDQRLTPPED